MLEPHGLRALRSAKLPDKKYEYLGEMSLVEIGLFFGVTKQAIECSEMRALHKCRETLRKDFPEGTAWEESVPLCRWKRGNHEEG